MWSGDAFAQRIDKKDKDKGEHIRKPVPWPPQQITQRTLPVSAAHIVSFQHLSDSLARLPKPAKKKRYVEQGEDKDDNYVFMPHDVPIGTPTFDPDQIGGRRHQHEDGVQRQINSPAPSGSFTGTGSNGSLIPPDVDGAVGPTYVMETNNQQYDIYTRAGTLQATITPATLFSSTGGNTFYDPHVVYDPFHQRFILVSDGFFGTAGKNPGGIFVAVSETSDPTGSWYTYSVNDGDNNQNDLLDYPEIGYNQNWVVVQTNDFVTSGTTVTDNIYVFNRASIYSGTVGTVSLFTDNNAFSWAPAQTCDTTTLTEWMVMDANGGSGAMQIGSITGTASSPTYNAGSDIAVTSANYWNESAVNAGQYGGTAAKDINSDDTRVGNGSIFINGSLWFAHTAWLPATGTATYSAVDWWQIVPSTLTLQQFGRIADPMGNTNYYYPAINVNPNGDALLGYCMSGTDSFYPSAAYSFHAACDAANTMEQRYLYKAGVATYYETFSGTRNRYGDYTGTAVDPTDGSFWNFSEWAASTTLWGTTICHVPPSSTLTATALTSFGTNVCIGTTAGPYSFTITGTNLTTANITVGPLTGFTFSTTAGGTYSSSLSLAQSGCSYSQTIYVEFTPTSATSYNGNIPISGGGATAINVAATGTGSGCGSPTLSASTIPGFGSVCLGSNGGPNSFTIMGTVLTNANVTVGPLTGFTFSTTSGGPYSSSLSLTQSGGSYTQVIYVLFSPASAASYSGNIPVGGGGAATINVAVTATGVGVPAITPGTIPAVCASASAQTASLSYTAATNSPTTYSISGWSGGSFANMTNATLPASPIPITVPAATTAGTYTATLTVANAGCSSSSYPISVTINATPGAVTVSPASIIACAAPVTITASGGSGGTIYYQGTTSNGTSTATPSASQTISANGTYYFNAEASDGCWSTQGSSTVAINSGLSGTFTIPGSYATLTAAVAAYNAHPICGPVVFQLGATYPTSAETFPITINANAGATATNTLTIEPASGATPTISGSNATAIIKLNAANYVTINGSAGGTGSNQNLTIKNTNTGTSSTVIYVASTASAGATNNTIKNCILTGNSATTTLAGVLSGGTTTGSFAAVANSNNTIQNNAITKAQIGVLLAGTTTSTETGNSILGNQISTMSAEGVLVDYEANLSVTGNTISGITSASTGTNGIYVQYTSTGTTISGNMISGITYTGATAATNVSGIFLASSTTGTGMNIYNNMIWDVTSKGDAGTGNNVYYNGTGITVFEGTGYNVYFNTINLSNAQTSAGAPACIWIYSGGTPAASGISIENNIFSNTETTPSGVTPYGIYSEVGKTAFTTIDYNDYYVATGTGFTNIGASNYNTIANIQTNFGGNTHSGIIAPNFTSATDLDLLSYDNFCLASGTAISGITTDIHGNTRNAPDMGADEFTFSFSGTSAAASCVNGNNTVTVTDPASTLAAGTYTVTYNLSGTNTSTGSTATMSYTAGTTNAGTFTIPAAQLSNTGSTTVTITKIIPTTACATALTNVPVVVTATAANQATFTVQTLPAPSLGSSGTLCTGSNITYTTQSGQSNYTWTIPGTAGVNYTLVSGGTTTSNTAVISWITSGPKTVSANYTNSSGCAGASAGSTTLTINSSPTAASLTDVIDPCNGGHTAAVNITGGTSPFTFTLTPAPGSATVYTQAVPYEVNAGGATAYSMSSVTDNNGCAPPSISGTPLSYPARTLSTGGTSETCTIGAGATQIFYDGSGNLMAQITANSTSLGSTTAKVDALDATVQSAGTATPVPYTQSYLQRHFHITPTQNASATVCLYLLNTEASNLTTASTANDNHSYFPIFASDLSNAAITKYDGGTETPPNHTSRLVIPTGNLSITANPTVNGASYNGVYQVCFPVSSFSGFYIAAQNPNDDPLPVTLLFVTANPVNNKYIEVEWATASEIDNSGFELQRSTDGNSFSDIGWVPGHLNSTTLQSYQYNDNNAVVGITYYYRLKQIDVDGNFTYSEIVSAALTGAEGFALTDLIPNPATSEVSIGVISNANTASDIIVRDMLGQTIIDQPWPLSVGYNTVQIDLSHVADGAYLVTVHSGAITASKRLVIAK